jgi:hypothetical protein
MTAERTLMTLMASMPMTPIASGVYALLIVFRGCTVVTARYLISERL